MQMPRLTRARAAVLYRSKEVCDDSAEPCKPCPHPQMWKDAGKSSGPRADTRIVFNLHSICLNCTQGKDESSTVSKPLLMSRETTFTASSSFTWRVTLPQEDVKLVKQDLSFIDLAD